MSIARGPWRGPPALRPSSRSSDLDGVEQIQRLQRGAHAQAGVQEAWLVGQLPHGIGVVHRRGRQHLHARDGQRIDGGLQLGTAVAEVGAKAEQANPCGHSGNAIATGACAPGWVLPTHHQRRIPDTPAEGPTPADGPRPA